ncbi:MAG: hypothetical protein M9932_04365 [Xanthobacteraceae bacterium]|nr:hypothetical protein [Xanthobacteraceae bacterium]
MKLTEAQRGLIIAMGFRSNALANGDEYSPMWWLEGGDAVKANVAKSLINRKMIRLTKHEGGQPGILFYTVTSAGRAALKREGK